MGTRGGRAGSPRRSAAIFGVLIALAAAVLWAVAASSSATEQASAAADDEQVVDDTAGDAPGAADLRQVRVRRDANGTTFSIAWTATPAGTPQEAPTFAWIDDDADAVADLALSVQRSNGEVAWELHRVDGGAPGCQPIAGQQVASGTAPLQAQGGLERFTVTLAPSAAGTAPRFRWAVLAYTSDGQSTHHDHVPNEAGAGLANPGDIQCTQGNTAGLRADLARGAEYAPAQQPPPSDPGPPAQQPPPAPVPPTAAISVAGPAPTAGVPVVFDASRSHDPDSRIVAFEWDWNDDGEYEANTGARPTATYTFGSAGPRRVGVKVTDATGLTGTAEVALNPAVANEGCETKLSLGHVRLTASCIRTEEGKYTIRGGGGTQAVMLNGLALVGGSTLTLDPRSGALTATGSVAVKVLNTPLGDITLYRAPKGKFDWKLPVPLTGVEGISPGLRSARHRTGLGYRLVSFEAGTGCTEAERSVCAKVPGGFPITGWVDVYISKQLDAVVDAHVEIDLFRVGGGSLTGNAVVRLDLLTGGLKLDELGIRAAEVQFGIFTLKELRFAYFGPGTPDGTGGVRAQDEWTVKAAVRLPTPYEAGVDGGVRFLGGKFAGGSAVLHGVQIPIGPGITLSSFGGGFEHPPTKIRGDLGLLVAGVANVKGHFLYEQLAGGESHIQAGGSVAFLGRVLGGGSFDYYSTGFARLGGFFEYRTAPLDVIGNVGVWVESQDDGRTLFQAEGSVSFRIWVISGGANVLINNNYIAGCGSVRVGIGRFSKSVSGYAYYNIPSGRISGGFGCDLGGYRIHPTRHAASAAQGGAARTLTIAPGTRALGLAVRGASGTPVVRLTAPDGRTFETPATPGEVAHVEGAFTAAQLAESDEAIVRLDRPAPGTWRIEPLPGSPAIRQVSSARPVPARPVSARVVGRGRSRTLVFRSRAPRGQRLRFVARGRDTAQIIGVTTRRSGRLRFTPQDGGARTRRIEVVLEDAGGAPRRATTVARFTAPAPRRPARPARVSVRRGDGTAIVTWRPARGATGYEVLVRGTDGRREMRLTSARRRRVVITRVGARDRLVVTVRGQRGAARRRGPGRVARLGVASEAHRARRR